MMWSRIYKTNIERRKTKTRKHTGWSINGIKKGLLVNFPMHRIINFAQKNENIKAGKITQLIHYNRNIKGYESLKKGYFYFSAEFCFI